MKGVMESHTSILKSKLTVSLIIFFAFVLSFRSWLCWRVNNHDTSVFIQRLTASGFDLKLVESYSRYHKMLVNLLTLQLAGYLSIDLILLVLGGLPWLARRLAFKNLEVVSTFSAALVMVLLRELLVTIILLVFGYKLDPRLSLMGIRLALIVQFLRAFTIYFGYRSLKKYFFPVLLLTYALVMVLSSHFVVFALTSYLSPIDWSEGIGRLIRDLADKFGFPLQNVHIYDDNPWMPANAFYLGTLWTGYGTRILIHKKFLQIFTSEQIYGFFAHELGHWNQWYGVSFLWTSLPIYILASIVFSMLLYRQHIYKVAGFEVVKSEAAVSKNAGRLPYLPNPMQFTLAFLSFYNVATEITNWYKNANSQIVEFQADAFAKGAGAGKELASGLMKGTEFGFVASMDSVVDTFLNTHPCVERRLKVLNV